MYEAGDEDWHAAVEEGNREASDVAESRAGYTYDNLGTVKSHRDLFVWQRSMTLVEVVFDISIGWRRYEQDSVGSQVRGAAVSVPSNIAEGYGRRTLPEFAHRLRIANGSLLEVETQLEIVQRIGLGDPQKVHRALELSMRSGQLLHGLLRSIERRIEAS